MAALDGMVLEHLADRLFTPERLKVVLGAYIARSAEAEAGRSEQLAQARRALTEAQGRMTRLLELVEQGLLDSNDPSLKERLDAARQRRHATADRVQLLESAAGAGPAVLTDAGIARVAAALRQALQSDDPAFRKAYLRLFVRAITVTDDEVRMEGPTAALAKAVTDGGLPPTGTLVPRFVRE